MRIRKAQVEDAEDISSLILNTAATQLRQEFSDDGWELFQRLLSKKTQQSLIDNKKFYYFLAVAATESTADEHIVGILAIKDKNHLFHFFVQPQWQGKGIGRYLWQAFLQVFHTDKYSRKPFHEITVNSSDFGLPFYQKLGFVMKTTQQQKNGVCYTPMIYSIR